MTYVTRISWIVPVQFAGSTAFQRCETLLVSLPKLSTAQFSWTSPASGDVVRKDHFELFKSPGGLVAQSFSIQPVCFLQSCRPHFIFGLPCKRFLSQDSELIKSQVFGVRMVKSERSWSRSSSVNKSFHFLKVLVVKLVSLSLGIAAGLPLGKDGPNVHVAACSSAHRAVSLKCSSCWCVGQVCTDLQYSLPAMLGSRWTCWIITKLSFGSMGSSIPHNW